MKKKIKELEINGENITCEFRRHKRAKNLKLTIYNDGRVAITRPWWIGEKVAEVFVLKRKNWILKNLEEMKKKRSEKGSSLLSTGSRKEYLKNKEIAREILQRKVDWFNEIYGFSYNKIAIRNQRTRWGSCSSKNNLNFNYRIIYLPEKYIDYLVVHELCHLKEMNHSPRFWKLVSEAISDCKTISKKLRSF